MSGVEMDLISGPSTPSKLHVVIAAVPVLSLLGLYFYLTHVHAPRLRLHVKSIIASLAHMHPADRISRANPGTTKQ